MERSLPPVKRRRLPAPCKIVFSREAAMMRSETPFLPLFSVALWTVILPYSGTGNSQILESAKRWLIFLQYSSSSSH